MHIYSWSTCSNKEVNELGSPGVADVPHAAADFPGVLPPPGVLLAPPDPPSDLLRPLWGVVRVLVFMEQFMELLELSVSLRCQRIMGPFVMGASILNKLLTSFSKLNCDISDLKKTL